MNRRDALSGALAAGALVAGGGAARAAGPLRTVTLSVGGASLLTYLPLTLAQRLNYFRDEGVDVQVNDFAGGAKSVEALVGGSVDMMCAAFEHTELLQPKGIALNAVALLSTSYGVVVGLKKAAAARYHGPADLKGMKIGVTAPGSSSALAVDLLLAKAGLPRDAVSIIGIGTGAAAIAAARSGELDGVSQFDPVVSQLVQMNEITPIVDTRTRKGIDFLYGGTITGSAISTKVSYAQQHRDTVQSVVNGIVRALHWLQKATPDQVAATVPPEFYGPDRDLYKRSFGASRALFSPDGKFGMAQIVHLYQVLSTYGPLAGQKVDLLKTFDASFVDAANRRYH